MGSNLTRGLVVLRAARRWMLQQRGLATLVRPWTLVLCGPKTKHSDAPRTY